ncbi:hypothetical protein PPSIR1_39640 [Plesiocystis pacifica SIR-1]|uniref:Uncharacterized protein n=1 Tax=Plesiocystis pacifica SIR-1 TaxID=391625 RepID=A6FY58_9BACT|nr:cadmium-containing carbonic anhydrase [Plesiocystis pacifica]EDM81437.1 hypothetical protein PPSIR1_39640 [Plesiocystis pacifica SIR-1]
MTPQDIKAALEARGWTATIVPRSEVSDIVDVGGDGLMKCVDGRPSFHPAMNGPKTLGGVYAIASMRDARDVAGLVQATRDVAAFGHVPSVHGDQHAEPPPMGCGYFKLWKTGKLMNLAPEGKEDEFKASELPKGIVPPNYSAEEGSEIVLSEGGVYETLEGAHEEQEVVINLVTDTTFEPSRESQRFVVDAWITDKFNIDAGRYLTVAAKTVELLSDVRKARIIVN